MEDDLIVLVIVRRPTSLANGREPILANERLPEIFGKWKTISFFWQREDKINILTNGREISYLPLSRFVSVDMTFLKFLMTAGHYLDFNLSPGEVWSKTNVPL